MSIIGVTIDYGPFGFMDRYDPGHICNGSGIYMYMCSFIVKGMEGTSCFVSMHVYQLFPLHDAGFTLEEYIKAEWVGIIWVELMIMNTLWKVYIAGYSLIRLHCVECQCMPMQCNARPCIVL